MLKGPLRARKDDPVTVQQPATSPQSKKGRGRTPIIIVPASNQSIITLFNIQHLLENSKYISNEVRKKFSHICDIICYNKF